ncbi:putative holin [Klebsiella phage vB_KaeD_HazelMika]|nr:putative holin [Klebsiella phage vB_KaeD_HazelMika]
MLYYWPYLIKSLTTISKGDLMREVINAITSGAGGATFTGVATGQLAIAFATFVFFVLFGFWGAYWKYKDSKAIRQAIDAGDLQTAIKIRGK